MVIVSASVWASTLVLFIVPVWSASLRSPLASVIMFARTTAVFLTGRAAAGYRPASSAMAL
jgi:hypothetical protein